MASLSQMMDLAVRLHEGVNDSWTSRYLLSQKDTLDRINGGKPYIACTFYVPGELCRLFDVEVLYTERFSGYGAAFRLFRDLERHREARGLGKGICSYQLMLDCLLNNKAIPMPHSAIALSYTCDDAWMYYRSICEEANIPFTLISVNSSLESLAGQFESLHEALDERYKRARTIDEVVEISNSTMEIKGAIDRLRLEHPGIMNSMEGFKLFTLYNDLGTTTACDILNELMQQLEKKVLEYSPCKGKRILWLGLVPLYNNKIIHLIEKRYDCRIVYEELFDFTDIKLEAASFFTSLARRIFESVFFSTENRMKAIECYIKQMDIDGIVHLSQRNCRFLPSIFPQLRSSMEALNIPFAEVTADVVDPLFGNEDKIWGRLDEFFGRL